jgi:hypothetical protein
MNESNHTLFPIFLRWDKEPLERRYAVAFVTREDYRQDIINLAGDKGTDGLLYMLMDFTFCTYCERLCDDSLDDCKCPVEGVKRASFHSFGFSENFWMNMEDASEEEPNFWQEFCDIEENFSLWDDYEEQFGETILLLWANMTFSVAHYYLNDLASLFDTLDEFGDPTGQLFKPLHIPFIIDIEEPVVWNDDEEDYRKPTKQEEESEVGLAFRVARIPEIILEALKKDDDWYEFTEDAKAAWYDDISANAADITFNEWMPGIKALEKKMADETGYTMVFENCIEFADGFLPHESDVINQDLREIKELEAGCNKTALLSFHHIYDYDFDNLIEVSFHFYVGSVVKVKVSAMKHDWKAVVGQESEENPTQEMDFTSARLLYREVLVFAPEPLVKDEEDLVDINDLFKKSKKPDLDPIFASFKRALEAI